MPEDIGPLVEPGGPARAEGPSLWRQGLSAGAVLVAGVALSVLGSKRLYDLAQERERRAIEEQAGSKAEQAQIAINRALESLTSVRALHEAYGRFSAEQFGRFVKSDAAFHRGTLALGWVPRVTIAQRAEFERGLRPVGGGARIFEPNGHGMLVPSPPQEDYFPVHFLVSLVDGELVQGMNLTAMSWLREPLRTAMAQGRAVAVTRMSAAAGNRDDYVIQAFLPVYRSGSDGRTASRTAMTGFSMGVFSVGELFRSVFDAGTEPYELRVYDVNRHGDERQVFALRAEGAEAAPAAGWTRQFHVADQVWRAVFTPRGRRAETPGLLPYAALAAGVLITAMLAAYFLLSHWRTLQVLRLSQYLQRVQQRLFEERVSAAVQTRLREQAQASEAAKTRLLQVASHDLRQPMNALGLYLGQARAALPEASTWLRAIEHAFESMRTMFDALLDWSRLETGTLQPCVREVEMRPLLERLGQEYAALARERGLRFVLRARGVFAHSDPVLLERMLRNLLTNAVTYTESGEVSLRCGPYGDGTRVRIRVADTGAGFSTSGRGRLFNAFERGAAHRAHHKGLGLGLAIVRQGADLLGHPLRLRSSPRRGSVFTIVVPAGDGAMAAAPADPTLQDRRVLLIDDDAAALAEMGAWLRRWGARVECAADLSTAAGRMKNGRPDLLIVDQHLADGSGLEFLERQRQRCPGLKAMVVSGDRAFVDGARALHADLVVLSKPVAPARLKSLAHFLLTEPAPPATGA
ncbi:MAG: Sensor histidine kinase RcsC [Gammaproteobacteria bacterium]|nr:Sensor histidine kinase RcsC [Gammaproteobacteria bacterium]